MSEVPPEVTMTRDEIDAWAAQQQGTQSIKSGRIVDATLTSDPTALGHVKLRPAASLAESQLAHPSLGPSADAASAQSLPDAGGPSPLSLAESHARLEVSAAKLGQLVKEAKTKADEAAVLYRQLRDELDETTRAIKAMDRIRHPQKRKP